MKDKVEITPRELDLLMDAVSDKVPNYKRVRAGTKPSARETEFYKLFLKLEKQWDELSDEDQQSATR